MNEQAQMMNPSQMMNQSQMMNRSFGMWPPPGLHPQPLQENPMGYSQQQGFGVGKPGRGIWKGKKGMDMRKDMRRKEKGSVMPVGGNGGGGSGYKPPTLNELQTQNRMKARRFYPKKKFNRFAPFAPRNTTSFIIRAKKSGGIASLVSPCPVTPAILPTPVLAPSREVLVDMAKEEWGLDGYGTMKGLIRLRSPGHDHEIREDREEEDDEEEGSSESDVEEHVEVERRLDHDLSRFEMVYPCFADEHSNLLENRVDDQDTHIAQLEEENLTLKERLFLMENELKDLRRRLQSLETENRAKEQNQEEGSENEGGDVCSEKSVGDGEEVVGDAE
ncbi:hypothetical protein H6P81_018367 [Aristolochia fimbriata]|uniref:PRLI-interacting factor A n=1 Tax=Aristolochia fimbriata TaxID=158543 RepID=A0AAV7E1M4_ARIFI|nr:hypothetical protein H6P81_018367 [Aristolochia fimbriata]